jgi:cytochrome c-type biogenesis protein CcmH
MVTALFATLAALLLVGALAFVVWPLIRRNVARDVSRRSAALKEQLEALKIAHTDGLIDAATFEQRRSTIAAEALALVEAPQSAPAATSKAGLITAVVLVLALPLATGLLYSRHGTLEGLAFGPGQGVPTEGAAHGSNGDASGAGDLASAAESLRQRMEANPEDPEGWMLLGRTYREIAQFAQARDAFRRVMTLRPEDVDAMVEYAEMAGLAAEPRSLSGEPETLLQKALALNPDHDRALWLSGFARMQANDPAAAEQHWRRLLGLLEPGSDIANTLTEQLNRALEAQGKPLLPMAAPPAAMAGAVAGSSSAGDAASANEDVAASSTAAPSGTSAADGIEVAVDISPELRSQLGQNDVLFVFARAEAGPPMPLAIARLPASSLPTRLRLDESMAMVPNMSLAQFERVIIGARVSKSGNAQAQSGDFEVRSQALNWREQGAVELTINSVLP